MGVSDTKKEVNQYAGRGGFRKVQMSGPLRKRRARGLNLYLLDMTRCTSNPVSPQVLFLPFTCTICKQKPIPQQIALTLFFPANDIWCIYLLKKGTIEREEKESSIFHAAPSPPRITKSWYIMQMPIKKGLAQDKFVSSSIVHVDILKRKVTHLV